MSTIKLRNLIQNELISMQECITDLYKSELVNDLLKIKEILGQDRFDNEFMSLRKQMDDELQYVKRLETYISLLNLFLEYDITTFDYIINNLNEIFKKGNNDTELRME